MTAGATEGDAGEDEGATASLADLDVAVAHWGINAWGGAEYLVTHLAEALDCDRVYTLGDPDPDDPNPYGDVTFVDVTRDLSPAPLRRLQAKAGRIFEYALWEDVDWREYGDPDVLVTSGATTRAVITPDDTLHLNYCHSPPRWFYDLYHDRKDSLTGQLARPLVRYLRMRDATVDLRVDGYFANSPVVARRIRKFYDRDSEVLYPPVDLSAYENRDHEGFYLHLGRLDEEKGVPAVVEAFAGSDHRLVLAGGRGDVDEAVMDRIRRADAIDYRGFVDEAEKYDLLATCRALVFNGRDEDFGIVPIEANASGRAVLTRDEGFPAIFVDDGENGYRHDGTAGGIRDAIERFERDGIAGDPRERANKFDVSAFRSRLREGIERRYDEFSHAGAFADHG
ncbi:glycosyltransferase [Halorientalis pallida]|uniref:Glycosyltransferase n=1 Tax=Halorientalis pallida TaxID=2479928 RepID=A0A498L184_9EURY|nr:glycosyltransferase [Halorientalis pallida]RXK49101.1 glycosyltransferase [Halorientalis pallida]